MHQCRRTYGDEEPWQHRTLDLLQAHERGLDRSDIADAIGDLDVQASSTSLGDGHSAVAAQGKEPTHASWCSQCRDRGWFRLQQRSREQ
ncbi:unnamed protein product, partial [Symbiodinium sp. KB8]